MAKKKKTAKADVITPPEETNADLKRPETVAITDPATGKTTQVSTKPPDLGEYKGSYKHKLYKTPFGLKVVEDDTHGRTHHLKNADHYWEGTEGEFKEQFEKS